MPSRRSQRRCRLVSTSLLLLLACIVMTPVTAQIIDNPRTLYRIAGGPKLPGNPDGVGPKARFFLPTGIVSLNDRLWVVDQSIHSLRRIDPDGRVETVIGQEKMCGKSDGPRSTARFCIPKAIVSEAKGALYIADFMNSTIRRFQDGSLETVAGVARLCSRRSTGKDDTACLPTALAIDNNKLYVTDDSSVLYRIDISTGEAKIIAGQSGCATENQPGDAAGFCSPQGIVVDPRTGMLYVADTDNHTI